MADLTIGDMTDQIADIMDTGPDDITAWLIVVHDKRHGFGYIHSRESREHPGGDNIILQMLAGALHDLVSERFPE